MKNNEKVNVYKGLNWKIMFPVMVFVVFQASSQAFSTILAGIASVFPDASATTVQLVLTVGNLLSIPVALLSGILASYFYKKHLILVGLFLQLIGGMVPIFFNKSITMLFVSSCIIGVGQAVLIPMASAVIGENFTGTTNGVAMGLKQAASSVGIAALTVATGFLARSAWYNAYYVYVLIVPAVILTAVMLPKGNKDVRLVGSKVGIKKVLTRGSIYFTVLAFFMSGFNFAFTTNIGMSIVNRGLGDSASVGIASAWNSLLTIFVGIFFGYILKAFKKYTLAAAVIIQAIAYFFLAKAGTLSLISIAGMIYGFGSGLQMITHSYFVVESVEQDATSMAISMSMAGTMIGIFASPVTVNAIASLLGPLDGTTGLVAAGIGMAIIFVIEVIFEKFFNKQFMASKS